MEILLFWFVFAIGVGVFAANKGRSGFGFFVLSLILSPLIGFLIALLASPDRSKAEQRQLRDGDLKKCPFCAELIKSEAFVCKHCGRDLPDREAKREVLERTEAVESESPVLVILIPVIGFLLIYAFMKWL